MRFGMMEMLLIFGVLLLFFGASRLPTLGSSLGSAIKNFKKGFTGDDEPTEKQSDSLPERRDLEGPGVSSKSRTKDV